jgi:hypothetical protein
MSHKEESCDLCEAYCCELVMLLFLINFKCDGCFIRSNLYLKVAFFNSAGWFEVAAVYNVISFRMFVINPHSNIVVSSVHLQIRKKNSYFPFMFCNSFC